MTKNTGRNVTGTDQTEYRRESLSLCQKILGGTAVFMMGEAALLKWAVSADAPLSIAAQTNAPLLVGVLLGVGVFAGLGALAVRSSLRRSSPHCRL